MEEKNFLIGRKPKKEWESMFGHGQVVEMMWVENGQIRVWKREPFRNKYPVQHFDNFFV